MLLLEYLLRRRDVRPSILFELHQPLERRQILPLGLVVHDVGHVLLLDLLAGGTSMDTYRGHTYGPEAISHRAVGYEERRSAQAMSYCGIACAATFNSLILPSSIKTSTVS